MKNAPGETVKDGLITVLPGEAGVLRASKSRKL